MKNTQVGMTNNFFILLNAIVLINEAENTTFLTFHPSNKRFLTPFPNKISEKCHYETKIISILLTFEDSWGK